MSCSSPSSCASSAPYSSSSPHSHLRPPTDHIWSCVHCGYGHCFSQNPDCDPGIQGQETRKNHEAVAGNKTCYVSPMYSMIQVIICGIWLGASPPFLEMDTHYEPKELLIVCNKGSVTAFYCVLGYLGSLALGTFLAFLARNVPDTFSEANFLTFSMLVLLSVCSPSSLSATAPRARSWWPWRSSPSWPPVLGS